SSRGLEPLVDTLPAISRSNDGCDNGNRLSKLVGHIASFPEDTRMPEQVVTEQPKRQKFQPKPETLALLRVSGNPINGLGETEMHRPRPFFWHPPHLHPFADLQVAARATMSKCPGYDKAFAPARNHPPLIPVAKKRREGSAGEFSACVKAFALENEADDVGIAPMDPLYVFEGYQVDEPWVIVLAVAHNYERLKQVPS